MLDASLLFSINNLLTVSCFTKGALSPTKTTTDLVNFLFSFRFEVKRKQKNNQHKHQY